MQNIPKGFGPRGAEAALGPRLVLRAVLYLASSLFCGAAFSSPLHWFWLPEQASLQGAQIDRLFNLIFWITAVIFVAVELTLAIFRVRYRKKDGSAATYTSGNRSLEVVWTVIPALILVTLTFMSRSVRSSINGTKYEDRLADESAFDVMVMPEKFRWNISYPGPDGRLGTAGGSPGSQPAPSFAPARHPGEAPLEGCRSQLFPAGDADQAGCASQQLGSRPLPPAQLIFIVNFFYSMVRGRPAVASPWNANTLEWTVYRPGHGNFPVIPTVYRVPYEYSVPGMQTDFLPQSLAVRDELAVDDGPTLLPA